MSSITSEFHAVVQFGETEPRMTKRVLSFTFEILFFGHVIIKKIETKRNLVTLHGVASTQNSYVYFSIALSRNVRSVCGS
jgi:hypothetical protein